MSEMQLGDYHKVTLKELSVMDEGRLAEAFDQEMRRIAMDCDDRPGDKRVRKLTVEVQVKPILDDDGSCRELKTTVQFKSTVPNRQSREYSMQLRKNGIVAIRRNSEDNHAQTNFLGNEVEDE